MLDWARHLNLAPGVHASSQRGRFRTESEGDQMPLFYQQQNIQDHDNTNRASQEEMLFDS
jgi:hypothetical protein